MRVACKICVLKKGNIGFDVEEVLMSEEELMVHLENEHHTPVKRPDETEDECWERFIKAHPDARNPRTCKCQKCSEKRMLN